jgi:thiamine biosynthesis lipoprotein
MINKVIFLRIIAVVCVLMLVFAPVTFGENGKILLSKQFYYNSMPISLRLIVKDQEEGEKLSTEVYEIITNYVFNYSYEGGSYLSNITYKSYRGFVECSDDLLKMIGITMNYYHLTKGAISPTIGSLIDTWGFGVSPTLPRKEDILFSLNASSPSKMVISEGRIRLKSKKTKFYLKPFAIGLALEKVKKLLTREGVKDAIVTVDKRYSLIMGKKFDDGWTISIRNPLAVGIDDSIYTFTTKDKFISISSVDEDSFNVDFKNYFSILDPRSGYPPQNRVLSVAVVGKDGVESVALSRLLIVLGEIGGPKFAQRNGVAALFVVSEGGEMNFIKTPKWVELIDRTSSDTQKKVKGK